MDLYIINDDDISDEISRLPVYAIFLVAVHTFSSVACQYFW